MSTTSIEGWTPAALAPNFLGHFVLAGRLLSLLGRGEDPRVVSVGSHCYRRPRATIDFGDLMAERRYSPIRAYVQSKLADTLFGVGPEQRLRAAGSTVRSLVAHPGKAGTPAQGSVHGPGQRALLALMKLVWRRPPEQGARPLLYAASASGAPADRLTGNRCLDR